MAIGSTHRSAGNLESRKTHLINMVTTGGGIRLWLKIAKPEHPRLEGELDKIACVVQPNNSKGIIPPPNHTFSKAGTMTASLTESGIEIISLLFSNEVWRHLVCKMSLNNHFAIT